MTVAYIGYVTCTHCGKYAYINESKEIKIWHHPDDEMPLCEVTCTSCGNLVQTRLTWDHVSNFRKRGCKILDLNDKFSKLTEEEINEFDFDKEYKEHFNK